MHCLFYRQRLFIYQEVMMIIRTGEIEKQTQGNTQILNLTPDVKPVSYTHLTLPTIYSV